MHRDIQAPVPVRADPDRLRQAVATLLATVGRQCRTGDEVHIRVRAEQAEAVVQVACRGPDVDPAGSPRVLDGAASGTAPGIPGGGIGLAVVRELVTPLDGTVTASSAPGQGATVTIGLPLTSVSHLR